MSQDDSRGQSRSLQDMVHKLEAFVEDEPSVMKLYHDLVNDPKTSTDARTVAAADVLLAAADLADIDMPLFIKACMLIFKASDGMLTAIGYTPGDDHVPTR